MPLTNFVELASNHPLKSYPLKVGSGNVNFESYVTFISVEDTLPPFALRWIVYSLATQFAVYVLFPVQPTGNT